MQIGGIACPQKVSPTTIAGMHPHVVRALVLVAVVAILAVSAIPLLILLDLTGGGTGWGICEQGIDSCRVGNFSGPRLAVVLMTVLLGLGALVRFIVWLAGLAGRSRTAGLSRDEIYIP